MDPKPAPRIRDPDLMRTLHADPHKSCVLCGTSQGKLDLHHVVPKGGQNRGDDVRENLVFLDAECHRLITWNYPHTRKLLGQHLVRERPDVIRYILKKKGKVAGRAWLEDRLFVLTPSATYDISTP